MTPNSSSVTIEQAISRANWQLLALPLLLMVTGIGLGIYIGLQWKDNQWVPIVIGVIAGIGLAWIVWNYYIIKWKIWAYSGIDDIGTLNQMAVQRGMIYEDDSIFYHMEIKSKATATLIEQLEIEAFERYRQNGVADDVTIPDTYVVYYSPWIYAYAVFALFFVALGVWAWVDESFTDSPKGTLLKYIAFPFAAYMLYEFYKRYKLVKKPLLVFTNQGLYIHKDGEQYFSWNSVYPFRTIKHGDTAYLQIRTTGCTTELEFEFKESEMRLHYLYRIFSGRHKRNYPELYANTVEDEDEVEME